MAFVGQSPPESYENSANLIASWIGRSWEIDLGPIQNMIRFQSNLRGYYLNNLWVVVEINRGYKTTTVMRNSYCLGSLRRLGLQAGSVSFENWAIHFDEQTKWWLDTRLQSFLKIESVLNNWIRNRITGIEWFDTRCLFCFYNLWDWSKVDCWTY